jgi:glycosyltransferase involved in cell wall biosynthesis
MTPSTLFVGRQQSGLAWYRCALPAAALGCDWVGVAGRPPEARVLTGTRPQGPLDITGYEVVVLQLVAGPEWVKQIRDWQDRGVTVLYEIDDWLHGVRKLESHTYKNDFTKEAVAQYEMCMRVADGIICSTPWLGRRLRALNENTYVCRNGVDLRRYDYTRPKRDRLNVGWAGGSGHLTGARPWMPVVAAIMEVRDYVDFVSIGEPFADAFARRFGSERALHVPFLPMDTYAAALTHFDIALAPAGKGDFFKAKSDLRWLEASAIGIPTIGDPQTYPEIEHGVTGFHASTQDEVAESLLRLVDDAELRERVGAAAHEYVVEHRSIVPASRAWAEALADARSRAAFTATVPAPAPAPGLTVRASGLQLHAPAPNAA